jgi:hypothetical protein
MILTTLMTPTMPDSAQMTRPKPNLTFKDPTTTFNRMMKDPATTKQQSTMTVDMTVTTPYPTTTSDTVMTNPTTMADRS